MQAQFRGGKRVEIEREALVEPEIGRDEVDFPVRRRLDEGKGVAIDGRVQDRPAEVVGIWTYVRAAARKAEAQGRPAADFVRRRVRPEHARPSRKMLKRHAFLFQPRGTRHFHGRRCNIRCPATSVDL